MNFFGNIRGAIRASVGIATTAADIQKLIQLIKQLQNKTIAQA
jgi:selenocysteine lyase/cysteine desulfurase